MEKEIARAIQTAEQLLNAYLVNKDIHRVLQLVTPDVCWFCAESTAPVQHSTALQALLSKMPQTPKNTYLLQSHQLATKTLPQGHILVYGNLTLVTPDSVCQNSTFKIYHTTILCHQEKESQYKASVVHLSSPAQALDNPRKETTSNASSSHESMENYYDIALRNTYDELFELNITQNKYRIVYHKPNKYVIPPEKGLLSEGIAEVAAHMIHPDDAPRFLNFFSLNTIRQKLANGYESMMGEFRKLRETGGYKWASLLLVPMHNEQGDEILLCFIMDIDEKKNAEEIAYQNSLLRQQQQDDERYRIIVEQTGTIVLEWIEEANKYYMSPLAQQYTFSQNITQNQGNHLFITPQDVHPADWNSVATAMSAVRQGKDKAEITVRLRKIDGSYLWCKIALTVLRTPQGMLKRSIITINDVDAAIKDKKALEYRAEYDDLTGYYNFSKYKLEVAKLLQKRGNTKYSLWYCDLKNFKCINDMYGYDFGDRVLQYWAEIIAEDCRKGETFARISSDYFTSFRYYENIEELKNRFQKTADLLANYPELIGKNFRIELVSGIYCIAKEEDVLSIEDMLDRANIAQKSIKTLRGSGCAFYTEDMRKQILREQEIEANMQVALNNKEFCIYLQPQVDIQQGNKIIGAEALVRWNKPGAKLVSPGDFIPLFERNGFIAALDLFVFEEVCRFLQQRQKEGKKLFRISVNVSRISVFQEDFIHQYTAIKKKYAIPDGLLELECTETTVVENVKHLDYIMRQMRARGFLFSLDDFGSGYSSLNLLKDVMVDVLKLDMVFFHNGLHAKRDQAIVSSIIAMARELNMKVVAEGVETVEQLAVLQELGCDLIQGYLFGKPMPLAEFELLYQQAQG